jgi:hypothetical protein
VRLAARRRRAQQLRPRTMTATKTGNEQLIHIALVMFSIDFLALSLNCVCFPALLGPLSRCFEEFWRLSLILPGVMSFHFLLSISS